MQSRGNETPAPRRALLAGGIVAALVLLTAAALWLWWPNGQADDSADPTGSDEPSNAEAPEPLFASDEEALAAARTTYEAFLEVTDTVVAEGGANPERIDEFATPEIAILEKDGAQEFSENEYRLTGRTRLASLSFQSQFSDETGQLVVTAYACVDVSQVQVQDEEGVSVVSADRPDQSAFEVSFTSSGSNSPVLIVAANERWYGDGVC